jgi:hypothetical protein
MAERHCVFTNYPRTNEDVNVHVNLSTFVGIIGIGGVRIGIGIGIGIGIFRIGTCGKVVVR